MSFDHFCYYIYLDYNYFWDNEIKEVIVTGHLSKHNSHTVNTHADGHKQHVSTVVSQQEGLTPTWAKWDSPCGVSLHSPTQKKEPGTFITPQVQCLLTSSQMTKIIQLCFSNCSLLLWIPYYFCIITKSLLWECCGNMHVCNYSGPTSKPCLSSGQMRSVTDPDIDTVHWVTAGCQNSRTTLISKQ